uniref:Uncharacterized protein n=1 Tax=Anser brachyrhynchus TaxID=132585 RepID=A0A8B9CWK1_9AVES
VPWGSRGTGPPGRGCCPVALLPPSPSAPARAHGVLGQGLTPAFSMGMTSLLVPGTMLPPARPGSHPIVMGASAGGRRRGSALRSRTVGGTVPLSLGQVGHHGLLQGRQHGLSSFPAPRAEASVLPVPPCRFEGGCVADHVPQRAAPLSCSSRWGSSASASHGTWSCGQRSRQDL